MSDVWGAIGQAQNASQNSIDAWYHNRAQNALNQMYGPIAGNPQAALQMQQYNYLGQQDPQYVQQLALENQLNAGMMPSRIQNNQAVANQNTAAGNVALGTEGSAITSGNATNTATAATAGPIAAAKASSDTSAATVAGIGTAYMQSQQHVIGMVAFNNAARQALANNPNDPEGAFKAGTSAALAAGADPKDVQAATGAIHDTFIQNPASAMERINSEAASVQQGQLGGMNAQQRLDYMTKNAGFAKAHADLVDQSQKNYQAAKSDVDDYLAKQGPLGEGLVGIHAGQDALANISNLIPQLDQNSLSRTASEVIPGSVINQIKEQAAIIKGALSIDQMTAMKAATGGTSSGIRSTKEFEAAGEALANFDPKNMTAAQLQQQIANAKGYLETAEKTASSTMRYSDAQYNNIVARKDKLEADLNAALGIPTTQPSGAGGGAGPPPTTQPSTGAGTANPAPASSPAAPPPASGSAAAGPAPSAPAPGSAAAAPALQPADLSDRFNYSRGVQNFNPTNIAWGAWAKANGATGGLGQDQDHLVATFPTYAAGMEAAKTLATNKYNAGRTTANSLIAAQGGWTPGNPQAAKNIATAMGVGPDDDLNLKTPGRLDKLMKVLTTQEVGADGAKYIYTHLNHAPSDAPPQSAPASPQPGAAPTAQAAAAPQPGAISTPSAVPTARSQQPGSDVLGAQPSGVPQRPSAPTDANRAGTGYTGAPANIGPVGSIDMTGQNAALASRIAAAQAQQQLSKAPEQVMAGRALLAKYLTPDRRTA